MTGTHSVIDFSFSTFDVSFLFFFFRQIFAQICNYILVGFENLRNWLVGDNVRRGALAFAQSVEIDSRSEIRFDALGGREFERESGAKLKIARVSREYLSALRGVRKR